MIRYKSLSLLTLLITILLIIILFSSCDNTLLDIYTQVNTDYSGSRTIDLAIKTQYLQKGEVALDKNESLYDKILTSLPPGKIETYEEEDYTHFKSIVDFSDINFLQHVSIDNYSDLPPERFYAKMEANDYFFHSDYFFYDYVDMKIDESLMEAQGPDGDLSRIYDLFSADPDLFKITYQIKFPVKIVKSNADTIGEDNIAIWQIGFGDTESIYIEGKKTKFLSYLLLSVLGLIGIFILFLTIILVYSRRRRRISKPKKPYFSYDNYFKQDKYYESTDDRDRY